MKIKEIEIAGRKVGRDHPPYIVAEMSANHNGSLQRALDTILAAKNCGADAIKLQTYTADTMTIKSDRQEFFINEGPWKGHSLYDLYKWAETPFEWHKTMFEYANKLGVTCFSSPFDETAVDLLEDLNAPAYKVASFEATDLPLVRYIASTKKPMIISTGMANLEEIEETVEAARGAGCRDLILLHCISSYPAPVEESNLMTISDIEKRFQVISGLSDHSLGNTVSIASVAVGACFIEKHFMLDRNEDGPDSAFSIVPEELRSLVKEAQNVWQSLGVAGYEKKSAEISSLKFRRSIYFVKNMQAGDTISKEHIRRIRPGYGLAPKNYEAILGKKVKEDILAGMATDWSLIEE